MSTTETTTGMNAGKIINRIESHLIDVLDNGQEYYTSSEIADETDLRTKQVAAVINDIDEQSDKISIEKWAYSRSTTWLIKATE